MILIIAILMALLLPAINAAVVAAKNAQVAAEEQQPPDGPGRLQEQVRRLPAEPDHPLRTASRATTAAPYGATADPSSWPAGDTHVADLNQRTVAGHAEVLPEGRGLLPDERHGAA